MTTDVQNFELAGAKSEGKGSNNDKNKLINSRGKYIIRKKIKGLKHQKRLTAY